MGGEAKEGAGGDAASDILLVETALSLGEVDKCLFVAEARNLWRPAFARGVYGGQIIGQALVAAGRSVPPEFVVHSLHAQFLSVGVAEKNVVYRVETLRQGRSFAQCQVTASQGGRRIYAMLVSFHRQEPGWLRHQRPMPSAPAPETLPTRRQRLQRMLEDDRLPAKYVPVVQFLLEQPERVDVRDCDVDWIPRKRPAHKQIWMRTLAPLSDSRELHRCAAAYMSDMMLLPTALEPAGGRRDVGMMVSLDHAMWFHTDDFRADEWLLFDMESPRAHGARALCTGYVFRQDGTLVFTVAQEGIIRKRDSADRPAGKAKAKL